MLVRKVSDQGASVVTAGRLASTKFVELLVTPPIVFVATTATLNVFLWSEDVKVSTYLRLPSVTVTTKVVRSPSAPLSL